MSEADTPNNPPLPEPNASSEDSTPDLPEASGVSEKPQIVHLSKWRNLPDEVQPPEQEQPVEDDVDTIASLTPEADEHSSEMVEPSIRRANDADWFALAQKMRQRNHHLHEQVIQLRQALKEKQEALHLELMRVRDREAFITQQAEEMSTLQEQLARLFHALESSHQAAQRQQILIETLSEQLQSSQERVAQLERECALTQQRYNEQSHQLLQSANTCRELRVRLSRQQQQTLQFKVALEKSLEMTSSTTSSGQQPPHSKGGTNTSFIHKAQPIKPWSAEQELLQVQDTASSDPLWSRPIQLDPPLVEPVMGAKSWDEFLESAADISEQPTLSVLKHREETSPSATGDISNSPETMNEVEQEQNREASELELEQELLAEMTSLAEASGLPVVPSNATDDSVSLAAEPETQVDESQVATFSWIDTHQTHSIEARMPSDSSPQEDDEEEDSEREIFDESIWDTFVNDESESQNQVVLPQSNWPSPVLYPLRPPKRRKSLAAIELPSFPRYRPS